MNNSEILKKHLGDYLTFEDESSYDIPTPSSYLGMYSLLVNYKWENLINEMSAPEAFEYTKSYIEQMIDDMLHYGLDSDVADIKNRLNKAHEEMR